MSTPSSLRAEEISAKLAVSAVVVGRCVVSDLRDAGVRCETPTEFEIRRDIEVVPQVEASVSGKTVVMTVHF